MPMTLIKFAKESKLIQKYGPSIVEFIDWARNKREIKFSYKLSPSQFIEQKKKVKINELFRELDIASIQRLTSATIENVCFYSHIPRSDKRCEIHTCDSFVFLKPDNSLARISDIYLINGTQIAFNVHKIICSAHISKYNSLKIYKINHIFNIDRFTSTDKLIKIGDIGDKVLYIPPTSCGYKYGMISILDFLPM